MNVVDVHLGHQYKKCVWSPLTDCLARLFGEMASVRERAATLNLEEKLFGGPSSPYSQGNGVVTVENRSAALWSGLILHLKASVKVKHRRIHLKSHSSCFLGSEAMDVMMDHLSHASGFEGIS